MDALEKFLLDDKLRQIKIAVAGDALIDEYYYVDANRVSPEFPIPVMWSRELNPVEAVPGGAGNVCAQFFNFNVHVRLYGIIDEYAEGILKKAGVDTGWCVPLNQFDHPEDEDFVPCHTPIKRRFYQGQFPLCRWDIEDKRFFGLAPHELLAANQQLVQSYQKNGLPDVLILSDYNKGTLFYNPQDWFCKDTISIVDPKKGPVEKWKGCTVFKPNAKEAEELSGLKDWHPQCDYFTDKLGCTAVVITHGGHCVCGTVNRKPFIYRAKCVKEANSVIGAGDCFIAFLAMALARQIDIEDAVQMAFEAGAVYVQKKHNKPITKTEFIRRFDPILAKFVDPADLANRDFKLVWTNGCFDIMHAGHLNTLAFAKSKGQKLIVGVDDDDSVKKLKGDSRPIIPLQERMKLLAALECVDFVVPFSDGNPYDAIKACKPDSIVKGCDWAGNIIGSELVEEVFTVPLMPGLSTTNIIKKIKEEHAAKKKDEVDLKSPWDNY